MVGRKCEHGCTCGRHTAPGRPLGSGMKPLAVRLWAKADRNGPVVRPELGPCWLFTGHVSKKTGYGRIGRGAAKDGVIDAHRAAWLVTYGEEPEDQVLHRCDVRPCIRPTHLFDGTSRDNTADMIAKGRGYWQENAPSRVAC